MSLTMQRAPLDEMVPPVSHFVLRPDVVLLRFTVVRGLLRNTPSMVLSSTMSGESWRKARRPHQLEIYPSRGGDSELTLCSLP